MKKLIASTVIVLIAGMTVSTSAGIAGITDAPVPLRVKIATYDGKKKVKVAKKLKTVASCSKACSVKITFAVRMPGGTIKDTIGGTLEANRIVPIPVTLNHAALSYLKQNYRQSRFTVNVSAKDVETGKRVVKKKSFRFFR